MTTNYNANRLQASWDTTMKELATCFERWGVSQWQIRPMRPRRHGYGDAAADRMVMVDYERQGRIVHLSMGKHSEDRQNLRVLYLAIEALRMNEVRGLDDVVADAYAQLAAPKSMSRDPYEVLGVRPDAPLEIAEAAYRQLAKSAHPDAGGSDERMKELNEAIMAVRS